MSTLDDHFAQVRASLLTMYRDSGGTTRHPVVMGTLRESFIRATLQGHLPGTASWSTGEILGYAASGDRSGQMDIVIHCGDLPQVHLQDGFVRVVPSDACIGIVEVKSNLTTGKAATQKPVLNQALASLVSAKRVSRKVGPQGVLPVPFHIVAFRSGVKAQTVANSIQAYLAAQGLDVAKYWPESVLVFEGAKKTEPDGYGLFLGSADVDLPTGASLVTLKSPVANLQVRKVGGPQALTVFVALLSNATTSFDPKGFRLERYAY